MYKQIFATVVVSAILFGIDYFIILETVTHLVSISVLVLLFYTILYIISDIPREIMNGIKTGSDVFD